MKGMNKPHESLNKLLQRAESTRREHQEENMCELQQQFPELPPPKQDEKSVKNARRRYVKRNGDPYPKRDKETMRQMLEEEIEARQRRIRIIAGLEPPPRQKKTAVGLNDAHVLSSEYERQIMNMIRAHATDGAIDIDLLWEEYSQDPGLNKLETSELHALFTACIERHSGTQP